MDEKFAQEQEAKAFDEALANDCICSLQKQVDELMDFIAGQSVNCFESDCRDKAIEVKGRAWYITYLITHGEYDALKEEDWQYVLQKINKED